MKEIERVCIECSIPLDGPPQQKRCPECAERRKSEKMRETNRRFLRNRKNRVPKAGEELPENAKFYRNADGKGRWQWQDGPYSFVSISEFDRYGRLNVVKRDNKRYVASHVQSSINKGESLEWRNDYYLFGWHYGYLVISLDTLNDTELFGSEAYKLGAYYRTEDWSVRHSPALKEAEEIIDKSLSQYYSNDSYVIPSNLKKPRWNGYSYT